MLVKGVTDGLHTIRQIHANPSFNDAFSCSYLIGKYKLLLFESSQVFVISMFMLNCLIGKYKMSKFTWVALNACQCFRFKYEFSSSGSINNITLPVLKLRYSRTAISRSWLLVAWLCPLSRHQLSWYWLCRINKSLSSMGKHFNCLCHLWAEEWKCKYVSSKFPRNNQHIKW